MVSYDWLLCWSVGWLCGCVVWRSCCCGVVWCVMLCCVVPCGAGVVLWCCVVVCVVCVRPKRPRVYQHHAHMLKFMCAWCQHTRGRVEWTHKRGGGRGSSSAYLMFGSFFMANFLHTTRRSTQSYHVLQRFTERNTWIFPIFNY